MRIDSRTNIAVIGVGGIGSNLVGAIASALSTGALVESLGGVNLALLDHDIVEEKNLLLGQRFSHEDLGKTKVAAVREAASGFESDLLVIEPMARDVRQPSDLPDSDITVVCVDNMGARGVVHGLRGPWLDLRCAGDGYLALDHTVDPSVVASLSQAQGEAQSCQLAGALESGLLQAGFLAAAAHGYQWLIAALRQRAGLDNAMLPVPRSSSVTFGVLGRLPIDNEASTHV